MISALKPTFPYVRNAIFRWQLLPGGGGAYQIDRTIARPLSRMQRPSFSALVTMECGLLSACTCTLVRTAAPKQSRSIGQPQRVLNFVQTMLTPKKCLPERRPHLRSLFLATRRHRARIIALPIRHSKKRCVTSRLERPKFARLLSLRGGDPIAQTFSSRPVFSFPRCSTRILFR